MGVSRYAEDIHKLVMLFTTLLAPIIGAVFAVEIVDKQRHCQTWWTLPLLAGLVSFSIGVALISKLWQQFSSHKQRRQLEDNVNVVIEFVINNVRAGTIWMNLRTVILIEAMRAEINQPREQRIGILWYTERAALVLTMVGCPLQNVKKAKRNEWISL